jgi:hypothetical protein
MWSHSISPSYSIRKPGHSGQESEREILDGVNEFSMFVVLLFISPRPAMAWIATRLSKNRRRKETQNLVLLTSSLDGEPCASIYPVNHASLWSYVPYRKRYLHNATITNISNNNYTYAGTLWQWPINPHLHEDTYFAHSSFPAFFLYQNFKQKSKMFKYHIVSQLLQVRSKFFLSFFHKFRKFIWKKLMFIKRKTIVCKLIKTTISGCVWTYALSVASFFDFGC